MKKFIVEMTPEELGLVMGLVAETSGGALQSFFDTCMKMVFDSDSEESNIAYAVYDEMHKAVYNAIGDGCEIDEDAVLKRI